MQQGKQQANTHADLYTQQRVAVGAAALQTGSKKAAASDHKGRVLQPTAAAAAAAEAGSSIRHSSKGPQSGEAHAAQKPSRIPVRPGQPPKLGHDAPTLGGSNTAVLASSAVARSAGPTLDTLTDVCDTAAAAGQAVAGPSINGSATVQNGNNTAFQADTSSIQQQLQAQHLRSATLAENSDWSQDSSTTSSEVSSLSPAGPSSTKSGDAKSSSSKEQRSIQGDSGDARCCASNAQQNGVHIQQHVGSDTLPLQLSDPQQQVQEHQQQAQQQQQQVDGSCCGPTEHNGIPLQQCLQESLANSGPGPPGITGAGGSTSVGGSRTTGSSTAVAASAAAAAAGAAGQQPDGFAAAAVDSSAVRARMSADPDYELPQGQLTETQVLLAHGSKLRLDRYGFIVGESDMAGRTAGAAAAAATTRERSTAQVEREQRHVAKWRRMLGSSAADFEAFCKDAGRMKKVKGRVRKGIPDEFRGYVWQLLSGGYALMQSHPGMYQRLLSHAPDAVDLEIMRDLNRTFPNHVFFHQRQGPGQQGLFHVLRAYSALDKQVGYVQGMGFVSAILLMYMSEESAFWTLVALLKGTASQPPLEGLYQAGMPLLQQCLFQFHELLKQEHPRLGHHLEQEGVVPSMYCTHWFNTLFAYSLPFEQLLRVWDVFLLEGMKVVFRVGIALLASAQEQLCAMPFERLVAALNGRKFPILKKQPDSLMKAALRIPVSKQLEQLRQRFLALQAETQAAAAAAGTAAAASGGGRPPGAAGVGSSSGTGAASGTAGHGSGGKSGASHSSKSSAAVHAQQQLIAGFAPVPMGPDT